MRVSPILGAKNTSWQVPPSPVQLATGNWPLATVLSGYHAENIWLPTRRRPNPLLAVQAMPSLTAIFARFDAGLPGVWEPRGLLSNTPKKPISQLPPPPAPTSLSTYPPIP